MAPFVILCCPRPAPKPVAKPTAAPPKPAANKAAKAAPKVIDGFDESGQLVREFQRVPRDRLEGWEERRGVVGKMRHRVRERD